MMNDEVGFRSRLLYYSAGERGRAAPRAPGDRARVGTCRGTEVGRGIRVPVPGLAAPRIAIHRVQLQVVAGHV